MLKGIRIVSTMFIVALVCGSTAMLHAQQPDASLDASPTRYFRLDFRVLQISPDGKIADSRSYSEMVASGPKSKANSSLRTKDQVPVPNGGGVAWVNTGANFDVRDVEASGEMLRLNVTADVSTIAPITSAQEDNAGGTAKTYNSTIIRNENWSSDVSVQIGKPTMVLVSDHNGDHGKTELELTAVSVP